MIFGGKKKAAEQKSIPLDEIKAMATKGMSDKDIIKELKHRGFSYNEIEKSMLQAVKEGVDEEPMSMDFETAPQQQATQDLFGPLQQDFEAPNFEQPEEGQDTSAILEELIEGVIDEKWQTFEDKFGKMEESFDRIKSEIRAFEMKIEQQKNDSPTRELEVRISDVSQQLEDLDARVGGLEKAFKQFLPALTKNIESLSNLIHEMKEKSHIEVEEDL